MDISCLEVIQELSNYIDKDVTPKLLKQIIDHLRGCSRRLRHQDWEDDAVADGNVTERDVDEAHNELLAETVRERDSRFRSDDEDELA